jgi:hypothetical protein
MDAFCFVVFNIYCINNAEQVSSVTVVTDALGWAYEQPGIRFTGAARGSSLFSETSIRVLGVRHFILE